MEVVRAAIVHEHRTVERGAKMPIKIFVVQGDKSIGGLDSEINKWQQSLGSKASVTHVSTAMTEHQDEAQDWQTRLAAMVSGDFAAPAVSRVEHGAQWNVSSSR
jgi:hypothetical protein